MSDVETLALGKSVTKFNGLQVLVREGTPLLQWTANCAEFTCRCPVTGQPDYASIEIVILSNSKKEIRFIETKTLKLFLEAFRDRGIFHEDLAEEICARLFSAVEGKNPVRVLVRFNQRGGIGVEALAMLSPETSTKKKGEK